MSLLRLSAVGDAGQHARSEQGQQWPLQPQQAYTSYPLRSSHRHTESIFEDVKLGKAKLHREWKWMRSHARSLGVLLLCSIYIWRYLAAPARVSSGEAIPAAPSAPRSLTSVQPMTLVATWLGDNERSMNSFPAWLHSIKAQKAPVEVIWLNFYSESSPNCLDLQAVAGEWSKVRQLCVHRDDFYKHIAEELCRSWECTAVEKDQILSHMQWLNDNDDNLVLMRPFLGHYLRDHIKTDWWAWTDSDMFLGDLSVNFPYSVMEQFDIITIAEGPKESFYLHGQFTAFRKSALLEHLQSARAYSSPEEFIDKMHPDHNAEEVFWSDALMLNERLRNKLNWLQIKGKQNDVRGTERIVVHRDTIIKVDAVASRQQVEERLHRSSVPYIAFTDTGQIYEMNRTFDSGACAPWNPIHFCPVLDTEDERNFHVYWMRKNGDYLVRFEPMTAQSQSSWHDDVFEAHFQCSKEWLRLPRTQDVGGSLHDLVYDFQAQSVNVWRKGQPHTTLYSQAKPAYPPDRGSFGYCPW